MGVDASVLSDGKSLMSGFWYGSVVNLSVMERHVMLPTVAHWWVCVQKICESGRRECHIDIYRNLFSHASRLKSQQKVRNFEPNLELNCVGHNGNDGCWYSSTEVPAYGSHHSLSRHRQRTTCAWHRPWGTEQISLVWTLGDLKLSLSLAASSKNCEASVHPMSVLCWFNSTWLEQSYTLPLISGLRVSLRRSCAPKLADRNQIMCSQAFFFFPVKDKMHYNCRGVTTAW